MRVMVVTNYFFKPASGLNADIERHRQKEQELLYKIKSIDTSDAMGMACYRAYNQMLSHLEESKARLVSKLGRK